MVTGVERIFNNAYDTVSKNIGSIDVVHKEVHEGNHYTYTISETATQDTDFIDAFFIGGGATEPLRHMTFEVSSNKAGVVSLYEGSRSSAGAGATVVALNNNRTSTKASAHSIRVIPDTFTTSTGTLLWRGTIGANEGPTRIGGQVGQRNEFIFASSKDYLIVHDASAEPANVVIVASWYEE